jgi:EmrB/QacA subfamily drug resistance transporter
MMTEAAPTRVRYQVTFIVLATAVATYALLQSLVIPALPTIQAGLHTSQSAVTWVVTAYLLSASIFTPIMGRLGDMRGKEQMLLVALSALAIGSLLSALAGSMTLMLVGRAIQGVGGGVVPLAFGIIRDEFPKEKVAGAVGVIAALAAVGSGVGLVLAGPIIKLLDYHWLFWIPLMVLVLAAVATRLVIPKSPVREPARLNGLAALLLSAWLVALLLSISEAPSWGWGSARVIGLLGVAGLVAAIWVVMESQSEHPLIDMRMMRIPVVWTTNLVAVLFGVGMYATFAFLPEFLQTSTSVGYGFGLTITQSGLIVLPLSITMFVFGVASGRLTLRFGAKRVLVAGSTISVVPFLMLAFANDHRWEIVLAMALMGAGFGLAFSAMSNLIVEGVPRSQTGVASGMNANIRTIGGSIGAAVMSSIVAANLGHRVVPPKSGYTHGFEFLAAVAIAGALAATRVPSLLHHLSPDELHDAMPHAELGMVAAGTLVGDEPE